MATSIVLGIKGVPYITVDRHFEVGEELNVDVGPHLEKYEVKKADKITREDQGQNVYMEYKGVESK